MINKYPEWCPKMIIEWVCFKQNPSQSLLSLFSSSSIVFFMTAADTLLLGSGHVGSGWYSTKPPLSLSQTADLQTPFQCLISHTIVQHTQGAMQSSTITAMMNCAQPGYSTWAVHDLVPRCLVEKGFCAKKRCAFSIEWNNKKLPYLSIDI